MLAEKTIKNIISEDFIFARVLDFFGVNFYECPQQTLEELCQQRNLSKTKLVEQLEEYKGSKDNVRLNLEQYPVELVLKYLKHAHHVFVKERLPYIARLIQRYNVTSSCGEKFMRDLQFIFPLFLKEFIEHIYEEEDSFFSYLTDLVAGLEGKGNLSKLYYMMEKTSALDFSIHHEHDESEMKGIRSITNNYDLSGIDDLHLQVIIKELEMFDRDLVQHALIEDDILIPKAIQLEGEMKAVFKEKIRWN